MNANQSAKTPEFRKVMRGYDPAEVTAYIDSLRKKLGESRRREQELKSKLDSVATRCAEVETKSEELDAALAGIDRERDAVLSDAHRRSAAMLDDTRKRCAEAEREMREAISRQRDAFVSMHEMILSFRADLFEKYNAQIDSIDSIASLADAYDEAMMFCMQKNGVDSVSDAADADDAEGVPAAETPDREESAAPAEMSAPTDEADAADPSDLFDSFDEPDDSDDLVDARGLADSPSFDYFTGDDAPSESIPDDMPADEDDFTADDVPSEDFTEEEFSVGELSTDDEDFSPVDGNYVAEDYSFDEDNIPHRSDADRILSDETSRVTRDDLPEDFDIYHASGDQLLELIYGKGSAAPAEESDPDDDPLRGVDYSFGDD